MRERGCSRVSSCILTNYMTPRPFDVAVIGGGPAGMMAAGRAAEQGAHVVLIEKNPSLGKKLLITGGGRCNILNAEFDTHALVAKYGRKGKSLFSTFSQLDASATIEFFQSRGIPTALLHKVSEPRSPNIREYLEQKRIDLVINIPSHTSSQEQTDGYYIRRLATDHGISLITNVQLAKRLVEALAQENPEKLECIAWPQLLEI